MIAADTITSVAVGVFSSGVVVAVVQAVFNRGSQRAESFNQISQAEARRAEVWFAEAQAAYDRVSAECEGCRKEVKEVRKATRNLIEILVNILPRLSIDDQDIHRLHQALREAQATL